MFNNIDDLFSAVNGLLQGKLDKAGNDLGRVMVNTLAGFGGLIDVASDAGIERGNEDFGQTFAVWGFPQGPYLFIPLFGPTTVRDGTGVIVRIALGPVGYIPDVPLRNSLYGVGYVDLRAQALDAGDIVRQGRARPLHVHPQCLSAAAPLPDLRREATARTRTSNDDHFLATLPGPRRDRVALRGAHRRRAVRPGRRKRPTPW